MNHNLRNYLNAVSSEIGIFSHINSSTLLVGDPKLSSYAINPCRTLSLGGGTYPGNSGGAGYDWESSILSALGEGFERYCPIFYDRSKLIKSSFINLNENAIVPEKFTLFHPEQYKDKKFKLFPFLNETEIHWTKGYDLINNSEIYVPASQIYMPFDLDLQPICTQISTGLASHTSLYKSILNGLYEVIERDAFAINWTHMIESPKIIVSDEIKKFISNYFNNYYEFHFFDITTNIGIPTVLGIMKSKAEFGEFICVGAATRFTFSEALKKTILELGQSVGYNRYLLDMYKDWEPKSYYDVNDFMLHTIFYQKEKNMQWVFDRYFKTPETKKIDFDEKTNLHEDTFKIKSILKKIKELKYDVILKDLTTIDVKKLGCHVIKVIIPQLVPLSGTYGYYHWGGNRLYEAPKKMGFKSLDFQNINKLPHPFP